MNGHRSVFPLGTRDLPQLPSLLSLCKTLLLIARLDPAPFRQNPDLQQMHRIFLRRIRLAMPHARARTHALPVPRTDNRSVAHAVLVLERTFENVGDDLHIAMRMRG